MNRSTIKVIVRVEDSAGHTAEIVQCAVQVTGPSFKHDAALVLNAALDDVHKLEKFFS